MAKDKIKVGKKNLLTPNYDEEMTWEEVQKHVDKVRAAFKPLEDDFMRTVQRLSDLGYGRMIQLIQGEWRRVHKEKYGFELGKDFFKS